MTDRIIRRVSSRPSAPALLLAAGAVSASLVLAGCSSPTSPSEPARSSTSSTARPTSAASPSAPAASAAKLKDTYCAATRAAGAAKARTVGDDLVAVRAQAVATRALTALPDPPAGIEEFARSADANAALLEQFPSGRAVADVGLDPRFVALAQKGMGDEQYRTFVAWTIQTCRLTGSAGG